MGFGWQKRQFGSVKFLVCDHKDLSLYLSIHVKSGHGEICEPRAMEAETGRTLGLTEQTVQMNL